MHATTTHATPGPEHARLAAMAGAWDVQLTVWQKAGEAPLKSRGVALIEPLFGGLFVQERLEGLIGERPFVELSWLGFDPAAKHYQRTGIASGSAAVQALSGSWVEAQGALVLEGSAAIAGDRERRVVRQATPDEILVHCQRVPRSDQPWTSCELRYTRRKS